MMQNHPPPKIEVPISGEEIALLLDLLTYLRKIAEGEPKTQMVSHYQNNHAAYAQLERLMEAQQDEISNYHF